MRILLGGCFNKIHLGHVYLLTEARYLAGDHGQVFLWVVLTHDKNNFKKNFRPAEIRIKNLESLGLVHRVIVGDRHDFLKTTARAGPDMIFLGYDQEVPRLLRKYLKEKKIRVKRIDKLKGYRRKNNQVIGRVFQVIGRGAHFMGIKRYKQALERKLGLVFSPGTLNLELARENVFDLMDKKSFIKIKGFKREGKNYGSLLLYPIVLKKYNFYKGRLKLPLKGNVRREKAWVVIPFKTSYNSRVIEIIRAKGVGEFFDLRNDDLLEVAF
ncbi:MAG: DUF120 domain-containing protein [Patescibacteria group bacterium]|nr:DUF120 domain-containing protein [Patescibacteria group bacterium]